MGFKYLPAVLLVLCISTRCFSQSNLTGTWVGEFSSDIFDPLGQPKLVIEIYDVKDSLFTGISHLYYKHYQYEHYKIAGRFFKKDSLLAIRESETIAVDLGDRGNCMGTYMMKITTRESYMQLDGIWVPNRKGCTANTPVSLHKMLPPMPAIAPAKKKKAAKQPVSRTAPAAAKKITTPISPAPTVMPGAKNTPVIKTPPVKIPASLAQRETDLQSLLEIDSREKDSIKVDVYDNGDIDGDSVSVYEEQVIRINKKMITAKPITFYVSLDKNTNPITHLRLVAESLGTIPPCTALMIVTTKMKRYEVRLSSNFKKNATVELFLKE